MASWTGKQLTGKSSRFTVLYEIGRGGFGVVYLAEDEIGSRYALKLIGPVKEPEVRASFEQEIQSTSGLDHPNLLRIHDYGETESDDQTWLFTVAEYCSDGDYRHSLNEYRTKPPSIEMVIYDMQQILQGLEVLHSRIIHRDLKPENVFLNNGTLKVADFGLAKFVDAATRTLTFKGGGTPLYMAPETWLMKRATPATDLYSLGIMFFEIFAGKPPFSAADIYSLRDAHLYTPAPRIKSINASVPDLVDGVIKKLLNKDLAQRYKTAQDVLVSLQSFLTPEPLGEVAQIAKRIREQHDATEKQNLEEKRRQEEERDKEALNNYMEKELVRLTDEVIDEVNANLVETKIKAFWEGKNRSYSFGRRTLRVHFFYQGELFHDPKVPGRMEVLREHHVVHGGFIEIQEDLEDREGWNLFLVRHPESTYGEWRIVETKASPLTGRQFIYEPVATTAQLFADNLACHLAPMMHSYTLSDKLLERSDIFKILNFFIPEN